MISALSIHLTLIKTEFILAPSVTSVANDKGDNEMIPGAVHRSPDICLTAEENRARRPSGEKVV